MALIKIKGQVVSQPLVITNEQYAVVILLVKTDEGCKEIYRQHLLPSIARCFAAKFVRTWFSLIALSAIGDIIEASIWSDTGEIYDFENKTNGRSC